VGQETEVLVEGASRRSGRGSGEAQFQGRDPYHRVVNFRAADAQAPASGALVRLTLVEATPHSLIGALETDVARVKPRLRPTDESTRPAA
jgi:tRNA A37 methylthiotransferase MiaB